jgi:O-succinylbenzoate synthase
MVLREIALTLKRPFRISTGVTRERRIVLVELIDADGAVGWGECVAGEAPFYAPETTDTAWLVITRWVAPCVLGRAFGDPREVAPALAHVRGHNMAKAAVEMAAWDLAATARSVPLAELLGGSRAAVETGISLGIEESLDALIDRAREATREGYRRIKLKIEVGRDVEVVERVRAALGSDVPLMADANGAYAASDPSHLARLQELDGLHLMMLEQPLASDDLLRHARLQRKLVTPLCLDESITSPDRAADMIALGAGKVINVKPGRVGGLGPALAIHDLAREHDVPVWCGGMLESGIGRGHNVALASLDNFRLPGDVSPSRRYWERDIVAPEWEMTDGRIPVPLDRPGLGVEVDRELVDAITVRREMLEAN